MSASSRLQALAIKFGVTSCVYLGFCLELGMVEETYAVRVMENIVDSPGHFLVRPIMPPVFWTRHVAWAITTSIDIHQLVSVASSSPRGPVGARSVPIGLQVYVLSLNVMSRPARSPRPPDAPPRRADAGEAQAARARAGGDARLLRRPHQVDLLHLRRGPLHRPAPPRPAPPPAHGPCARGPLSHFRPAPRRRERRRPHALTLGAAGGRGALLQALYSMILNQLTSSSGLIAKVAAKNKVCSPLARARRPRARHAVRRLTGTRRAG